MANMETVFLGERMTRNPKGPWDSCPRKRAGRNPLRRSHCFYAASLRNSRITTYGIRLAMDKIEINQPTGGKP
jgi:hypothetical protein